ncbi:MAG: cyanophycin synthetase [Anaerolineae bacterium]
MRILETRVYRGPNPYGYRPLIRLILDLEDLEDYPTDKMPGFIDNLLALLPSLEEHGCSYGRPGGFIERMREGTWPGHVVEHVALELQSLAGTPVTYGKTRTVPWAAIPEEARAAVLQRRLRYAPPGEDAEAWVRHHPGVYYVIYSYQEEKVGVAAGDLAIQIVRSLVPLDLPSAMPAEERATFNPRAAIEDLARLTDRLAFGPSTGSIIDAARKRGIPYIRLNERSLVQLGYGIHQKRIQATVTSETRHIAVDIAQDKELTTRLLDDMGIPVPRQIVVSTEEDAVEAAERIGYPVVTKPLDASHGRGVSLNLNTADEVRGGFQAAIQHRDDVIVETFLHGYDYRVLVVKGEVVAVSQRIPGHVVGDGTHTVRDLVDIVNSDPRRGVGHEKVLTRIEMDRQAERLMRQAGVTLDTVLPDGQILYLRSTGNLSTGGTAIDRTDEIHFDNAEIARLAAKVVGLDVAGIDFITPDIARSVREVGGGIVEVNAAPGFRMHVSPSEGKSRDAAGPVIDMLFPPGTPSRIPIAAITGTNGKTTTSRMVAHILKMSGKRVGLTTTDGIYINGERYLRGDMTGPWSARMVLKDPTVEVAVLETARGGILREGLGFDRCDVGAVLNVSGDHLGLRGVETLEDLAEVKRLVVEVVKDDGTSVLNADDPLVAAMVEHAEGKPFYFTMNPRNQIVRDHIAQGGRAVVLEEGVNGQRITLYDGERYVPVLWTHLIPATLEGAAMFNVANSLAATAVAYAMGISLENIRQGLRTFATTFFQTPGRLNVFDRYDFRVLVDYAHNPAAVRALCDTVKRLKKPGGRAIGVVAMPGDRRDQDLRDVAAIAAKTFDEIVIKEDASRRGRPPGEIARIMREAAIEAGMLDAYIDTVLDEIEATRYAMMRAQRDDLVVILADDITAVWKAVIYFGRGTTPLAFDETDDAMLRGE